MSSGINGNSIYYKFKLVKEQEKTDFILIIDPIQQYRKSDVDIKIYKTS